MTSSDLEIARSIQLKPIQTIGENLGILPDELDPYGKYIGKIDAPASRAAPAWAWPSPRCWSTRTTVTCR